MHGSTVPTLAVLLLGYLLFLILRLTTPSTPPGPGRAGLLALWTALLAWAFVTALLAASHIYLHPTFLSLAPGYWLPFVPVALAAFLLAASGATRAQLASLLRRAPPPWLTAVHAVRLLAAGSLVKAAAGLFPHSFAWYVGLPDMVYGISAIPVTFLAARHRLGDRTLLAWHVLGALIILVGGIALMPIHARDPLFWRLFEFPMALAPTFVVPTLVMLNLLAAWRHGAVSSR